MNGGGSGDVGMKRWELYRGILLPWGYNDTTGVYCCQSGITLSIWISLLSGYVAVVGKYCSRRVTSLLYRYIAAYLNIVAME